MKQSQRARRMSRYHERLKSSSNLNLVSLMDIFTILVFFLLLNSSDVEVLDNNHAVDLPNSISEIAGENKHLKISIKRNGIWIDENLIIKKKDMNQEENDFNNLSIQLNLINKEKTKLPSTITLLADKTTPFSIINKVMLACSESNYDNVNFAVNKINDSSNEG